MGRLGLYPSEVALLEELLAEIVQGLVNLLMFVTIEMRCFAIMSDAFWLN